MLTLISNYKFLPTFFASSTSIEETQRGTMGGLPPDLDLILSQPQLLWRFLIIFEVGISVLVVNDNSYFITSTATYKLYYRINKTN